MSQINQKTMTVTIPARLDHGGYASTTVTIATTCPTCGQQRGMPFTARSYDGSLVLNVDAWHNECDHVDKYSAVRNEAANNGMNSHMLSGKPGVLR